MSMWVFALSVCVWLYGRMYVYHPPFNSQRYITLDTNTERYKANTIMLYDGVCVCVCVWNYGGSYILSMFFFAPSLTLEMFCWRLSTWTTCATFATITFSLSSLYLNQILSCFAQMCIIFFGYFGSLFVGLLSTTLFMLRFGIFNSFLFKKRKEILCLNRISGRYFIFRSNPIKSKLKSSKNRICYTRTKDVEFLFNIENEMLQWIYYNNVKIVNKSLSITNAIAQRRTQLKGNSFRWAMD